MVSYADTFFNVVTEENKFFYAYYPKRKTLFINFSRKDLNEVERCIQFVLNNKGNLLKAVTEHNLLLQKMEVEKMFFEASHFGTEKPDAKDFHDKILDGESKEIVEHINNAIEVENPFYYAAGMSIFWEVSLKTPFTIHKDPSEIEFKVNENLELQTYLESLVSDKTLNWLEVGYFNPTQRHHGFNDILTNKDQRRAFKFVLKNDFNYDDFSYYVTNNFFTESILKSKEKVIQTAYTIIEVLKKHDVNYYLSFEHHLVFIVYVK